jgi:hypothetical protein
MKKYLKEIETAGIILLFLAAVIGHLVNMEAGAMLAIIGLLLWVTTVVVKAMNWEKYQRENILNIIIMLGAILAIFISYFIMK